MQLKTENISPTKVKLSVEVDLKTLIHAKNAALTKLAKGITVSGYRRGKAPISAAERHIDPNILAEDTMQHAVSDSYSQALIELKLRPVNNPEITLKSYVPYESLTFEAVTEVIGNIKLGKYSGLNIKREPVVVEKPEIDSVISNLQKQFADKQEVKRQAKLGDEVIIDFSGKYKDSGELISGASGKAFPLELGSKSFIPGFETKLVGVKAGDDKQIELSFPKNYQVSFLQGKKAVFDVKILKVNELKLPKLDDSFAAKVGSFKTFAELKKDIDKELRHKRSDDLEVKYQNQLIEAIVDTSEVDVPDVLIEDEIKRFENELRQNAAYRSQTWDEYLASEGLNQESFKELAKKQSELRVKSGLILSEVATRENIEVSEKELDERISKLKQQYASDPSMQAELDKDQNRGDLRNRMMVEATVKKLISLNT